MPKPTFNLGIQLLRGVAALLVAFHHTLEESRALAPSIAPEWLIRFGAGGVDIFFVISGFIIYNVTYGRSPTRPERPGVFLLKRFLRIFPIYWICLAFTVALWASGAFYRSLHPDAWIFLGSLFLLPSPVQIVDVAWTLVFEMYFYYLFALALLLRQARLSVFFTAGCIVAALLVSHLLPEGSFRTVLGNPIALEFCYGLLLSHFLYHPLLQGRWLRYLWLPGFGLMALGAAYADNGGTTAQLANGARFWAWGLPALLVTASFIAIPFGKTFASSLFLPVGNASYSLYLTHPTVMIAFAFLIKTHRLSFNPLPLTWTFLVLALCLAIGLLVHYGVEQPILARLRRRFELSPPMP